MVGFPHSEIIGSKLIRSSPTLIAAYYVLHRLCTPRHPLNALKTLDRSHYQCPQCHQRQPLLKANVSIVGIVKSTASLLWCLIGQIKLTRIHVAVLFLPGVLVKRDKRRSLYDVERSGHGFPRETNMTKLALLISHAVYLGSGDHLLYQFKEVVEPDGIEPTTSCLQSRRSPS